MRHVVAWRKTVETLPSAHARNVAQVALVVIALARLGIAQVAASRSTARRGERVPHRAAEFARNQVGRRAGRGEERRHLSDRTHHGR
eukprot:6186410-Pleurochrysis_carterae.AAC.1